MTKRAALLFNAIDGEIFIGAFRQLLRRFAD